MTGKEIKRVAYWFSQKKKKKLNIDQLSVLFKKYGVQLTEIDFEQNLDDLGSFDAVIHKVTDLMIEEMEGNEKAAKQLGDFQLYLERYPTTIQIDPLASIKKLLDRYETYKLIKATQICSQEKVVHVPSFTLILSRDKEQILKQMNDAGVHFPIVCKKNVAHGTASHKMSIIFNEEGLDDVDPPCVAQTFVDHNALLYKVYVIADQYHMVERPSLKNFTKMRWKNHPTIFFNSHDISSGDCLRTQLTTLEDCDGEAVPIERNIVDRLCKQLHHEINMTLYGVDIIVCPKTLKHYVIDVNVFPGYDGVENYLEMIVNTVISRMKEQTEVMSRNEINHNGLSYTNGHHYLKANGRLNGVQNQLSVNGGGAI